MKVILTVGGLSSEDGGPSRSIPALALALVRAGLEVEIVTCQPAPNQTTPSLPPELRAKIHFLPRTCRSVRWQGRKNAFADVVSSASRGVAGCILHDAGLWLPTNHATAKLARELGVPLIISPRGMLTAWALQFRGLKKRIAWQLYQRRDLKSARVLHATSQDEATGFRALGLTQPIAVIPNGVTLPPARLSAGAGRPADVKIPLNPQASTGHQQPRIRTALFLSRIHPKKGLLDLVEAWHRVRPENWRMVIAGGDENGHRAQVEAAVRERGLTGQFEFIGETPDEKKWDVYRSAELFLLPTKSENFGIVIAEALACGLPVITTQGTPWAELVHHRCGWWVEIGPAHLAKALSQATSLSDEERHDMGMRGRELVEKNYSWAGVAAQMKSVYQWILGQGPQPLCIASESCKGTRNG